MGKDGAQHVRNRRAEIFDRVCEECHITPKALAMKSPEQLAKYLAAVGARNIDAKNIKGWAEEYAATKSAEALKRILG